MVKCLGGRKAACFVLLALCIAITVSAFVLGVVGIVEADTGDPTDAWYLMGASSVTALLLPLVATPLAWVIVELLVRQTRASDAAASGLATDTADIELQTQERSDPPSTQDGSNSKAMTKEGIQNDAKNGQGVDDVEAVTDDRRPTVVLKARETQFLEAEVYNVQSHKTDCSNFQSLNKAACAMMYITLTCFSLSGMCLMWNIFIGVRYNKEQDNYWPSITCHTVLNILCPAFGIVGLLLLLNMLTYTSCGQIDFRVIYCYLLASVKIVNGEMVHPPKLTFSFWVIADLFYLRLRSPRGNPKKLRYYIDRTPATYILASFVCLSFTLAAWLFLEAMLLKTLTVTTPVTKDDCMGYTCLNGVTPLSCHEVAHLNVSNKVELHCILFQYEDDIINSAYEFVVAILVYFAAVQLLRTIVILASLLLLIYPSKLWGVLYLVGDSLAFLVLLVYVIVMDSVDTPDKIKLATLPILFIPVGILLLAGGVKQVIKEPQRERCIIVKPKNYLIGLHHMNSLRDASSPESPPSQV